MIHTPASKHPSSVLLSNTFNNYFRTKPSLLASLLFIITGCNDKPHIETPGTEKLDAFMHQEAKHKSNVQSPQNNGPRLTTFVNASSSSKISFTYETGAKGNALMVESTGGGCGWGDFDRDGFADIYLVQGGDCTANTVHPTGDRLLCNLSGTEFIDVTLSTRVTDNSYGQGVAIGDYNQDGFPDILVTNVGKDLLWMNLGDGTFANTSIETGIGDPRWGSSAAWADLDLDGDLDLFVCNYLKYDVFNPVACRTSDGTPATCHPEELDPEDNECYENQGDGAFRPIAKEANLLAPGSKSLGIAIADFNQDGRIDLYVANDTTANHLFERSSDGHYVERAVQLGCAMNIMGQYQASMGIAVGDYDHNGLIDLYVTHFLQDSNTLYRNLGEAGFHDVTRTTGLHKPTLPFLAFGTVMADFNSDGFEEIFIANGDIDDTRSRKGAKEMSPQLFTFDGQAWLDYSKESGDYFQGKYVGRGVASADYDNDGDLDLAVIHQESPMALLKNISAKKGTWFELELIGVEANRNAIGAIVEVVQGKKRLVKHLVGGSSYCASNQPVLCFGLADNNDTCDVVIHWPVAGWPTQRVRLTPNHRYIIPQNQMPYQLDARSSD